MRILKATLLGFFCSSMAFGQVTTMNVYQSNNVLLQLPVSVIDSVVFTTPPPPSMSIYQTGGSVSTIVLANIDSITYTVTTNPPPPSGNWLNPNLTYGSVTDCSGNTYATIEIGTQEWMAENLRTTCYANGDELETVYWNNNANNPFQEFYGEWHNLADGAWCHYEADDQYDIPYGKLYNRYAVDDSRNVCPDGWHVPDTTDWFTLLLFLDSTTTLFPSSSPYNTNASAGEQLKSTYESWGQPNYANNSSGFSAIAGGMLENGFNPGGWNYLYSVAFFHIKGTSTHLFVEYSVTYPAYYGISDSEAVSIRCIKD
jgi:uncharacterized protein (TIGR02145 family)